MHVKHVIVLVHGLHGSRKDFAHVAAALRQRFPDAMVCISSSNEGLKTHQGIDVGGRHLAQEIHNWLWEAEREAGGEHAELSLTVVGHSLGGLFSRNAVSRLVIKGGKWGERHRELSVRAEQEHGQGGVFLVPAGTILHSIITLCSPHLGSRRPEGGGPLATIWRRVVHTTVGSLYGRSGKQLLLTDGTAIARSSSSSSSPGHEEGAEDMDISDARNRAGGSPSPGVGDSGEAGSEVDVGTTEASEARQVLEAQETLLSRMTDPEGVYMAYLRHFRLRMLVSLTEFDISVPFAAAAGVATSRYKRRQPPHEPTSEQSPDEEEKLRDGHGQEAVASAASSAASSPSLPPARSEPAASGIVGRTVLTVSGWTKAAKERVSGYAKAAKERVREFTKAPVWSIAGTRGLTGSHMRILQQHLSPDYVDEDKEGTVPAHVQPSVDEVKLERSEERPPSAAGGPSYLVDEAGRVEYDSQILVRFNAIPWRRIDVDYAPSNFVDHLSAHNFLIGKHQRGEAFGSSQQFIETLTSIMGVDMSIR